MDSNNIKLFVKNYIKEPILYPLKDIKNIFVGAFILFLCLIVQFMDILRTCTEYPDAISQSIILFLTSLPFSVLIYGYVGLVIKNVIEGNLKWVIGSGNNYIHPIHVWDLVRAFELIRKKGRSGEVYIVANEKPTRLKDFLNLVASFAGVRIRYGFPPMLAYLILKIKGGIGGATAKETILAFTKNWFYKIDKLKALGWRQEISLEKGVNETVEWFKIKI